MFRGAGGQPRTCAALLLAAFTLLAQAACGEEEESAAIKELADARAKSGVPGETITLDDGRAKIEVTLLRVLDPATGGPSDRPRRGRRFVGVDLHLKSVGEESYEGAPAQEADLIMSNDEDAPLAALSEGACGQAFGLGVDLPPGKARTICLPFEANRHLRPQAFLFTLGSLDRTAEWRIP